jgi:CubicO group peptidase (beta-lactamase class C family)
MQRYMLVFLLSLTACQTNVVSETPIRDLSVLKLALQKSMDEAQINGGLPGIAALITSSGNTVFQRSQGKRASQLDVEVKEDDQWHLGSDTKAMTAMLIALAAQEQKLTYESNVAKLLNSKLTHPLTNDLTIGNLLSHSSGLRDVQEVQAGKLWKELFKSKKNVSLQRLEMSLASMKEAPVTEKASGKPDRNFRYGNINYIILGAVLEKLYETSWENLLKQKIFDKLSMTSCGYGVAGVETETVPSQPWPHAIAKGQPVGIPPKEKADNPPMLGPAGTVHCNLIDWHKFVVELIEIWNGKGVLLTDQAIAKMYFQRGNETYVYGGWGRNDEKLKTPVFQHSGSNTLNFATAQFLPDKDLIVLIATNRGDDRAEKAMRDFLKAINKLVLR